MKAVYQTDLSGDKGNCFQACLASIFEIEIESIPDFRESNDHMLTFAQWCRDTFGLQPLDYPIPKNSDSWRPIGYHIILGPDITGRCTHAVVGLNGNIVFDPFPGVSALKQPERIIVFVKVLK